MSDLHRCPTCGSAVRVAGGEDEPGDGGTRHYEPVGEARLRDIMHKAYAAIHEADHLTLVAGFNLLNETLGEIARLARGEEADRG